MQMNTPISSVSNEESGSHTSRVLQRSVSTFPREKGFCVVLLS